MKKLTIICLAGLLMVATSAFAQDKLDFKASGFIDAQSLWMVNTTPGNPAGGIYNVIPAAWQRGGASYNRTAAWMESRARLKFDAVMGKSLSGTIFFEMDSTPWGNADGTRNSFGFWSGDRAALEIKNVYIDWGVPAIPVPVTVRVGLQPLSIRNNILVYTDGMGVTAGINIDPVTIQPLWFKAVEGQYHASDDVDVYGVNAFAKIATMTVGGYVLYYNMNQFPLFVAAITQQSEMWWFGLYADGKAGPVDINFDLVFDRGKVHQRGWLDALVPDVKYRGWATRLKVDFPWEKFNFGAVGYYASGADLYKTSSSGLSGTTTSLGTLSTKVSSYVVPPGSESGAIFGESVVFYSSWINRGDSGIADTLNYTAMSRGPIGGTWMAKAYASIKATPWYKATVQVLYIGDTTKHGNTFGTAYASPFFTTRRDDSSIGWEVDLIHEIQIYKNLKYTIGMGYLFAGKGMDFGYAFGPLFLNESPKNPWQVTTNLTYNF